MRVAAVANLYPQLTESWIRLQLHELYRRGVDVRLLSLGKGDLPAKDEPFSIEYAGHSWRKLPTRIWREGGTSLSAVVSGHAGDAASLLIPHDLKSLKASEADLLHCHFGHVGREVARLGAELPLVVSFYGFDAYRLPHVWGSDLFHSLFSRASAVLSLGPRMDERLLMLGCPERKLRRVPLAVDTERFAFRPRNPGSRARVVSVGRLVDKKGFAVGIEAASRLQRRLGVPVEYTIVGSGPLLRSLKKAAASHPNLDVRFLGARTAQGVWEALDQSDVCLVPSLTARHGDSEGTPVAALEAMAMGRPVIASDNGDLPSVLDGGSRGALCRERDADEMARAMESAFLGGQLWDRRVSDARGHVEALHSPGAVCDNLLAVYRNLFN